jgi:hypothetical protein
MLGEERFMKRLSLLVLAFVIAAPSGASAMGSAKAFKSTDMEKDWEDESSDWSDEVEVTESDDWSSDWSEDAVEVAAAESVVGINHNPRAGASSDTDARTGKADYRSRSEKRHSARVG